MVSVEVANRSGVEVDENAAVELARAVLHAEGIDEGELGLAFVGSEEMSALKREHLGIDEPTDVLSFPIDGREPLPVGVPRALGDIILCPQVVGAEWRWPLAHGLLHLLGYDHGEAMEARERELLASPEHRRRLDGGDHGTEVPALPAPEHRRRLDGGDHGTEVPALPAPEWEQ